MEQIKAALKCKVCLEIFSSRPIILTCCFQTICFDHIAEFKIDAPKDESLVKCKLCNKEILEKEFPTNTIAEEFLRLKISELHFGKGYVKSKSTCDRVKKLLSEVECTVQDPKNFIYESIAVVKNKIDIKREEFKLKIDTESAAMIKQLDELKIECDNNLSTEIFKEKLNALNKNKELINTKLGKWTRGLSLLTNDAYKWESIRSKSVLAYYQMEYLLDGFKRDLMLNKELHLSYPFDLRVTNYDIAKYSFYFVYKS